MNPVWSRNAPYVYGSAHRYCALIRRLAPQEHLRQSAVYGSANRYCANRYYAEHHCDPRKAVGPCEETRRGGDPVATRNLGPTQPAGKAGHSARHDPGYV